MVDTLSSLSPINTRVAKTQVAEKNPHHQNDHQQKRKSKDNEIIDEVAIETFNKEEAVLGETKKQQPLEGSHNIDIEA